ncbi:MAG: YeeE/YedE family protein [Kofleriaceae bacterium]
MSSSWLLALVGGALIGAAGSLLFLTHGRIAGISGVLGSLLPPVARDQGWRIAFMGGLLAAGLVGGLASPTLVGASVRSWPIVIVAGFLVGFGTRMGSGCTSGHGVCGLARLSVRSLVAVATFMTTGAVTASLAGGAL